MTCPTCGAVGHISGADGMCSRTALAEQAVRHGGMTVVEAAALHGVRPSSVYCRRYRVDARAAAWTAFDRVDRIRLVAARRGRLWGGYGRPLWEAPTLSWPDPAEVPAVDARGSDHEEVPDPPRLAGVGWATGRPRRAGR